MWGFCVLWVGLAASIHAAKMCRDSANHGPWVLTQLLELRVPENCFENERAQARPSCGSGGSEAPGERSPPSHTRILLSVGSGRVLSSLCLFVWLCLPTLSSVFLLASSSFSFTLVFFFPARFWCQDIYSFLLCGSHTIYIPSWEFQR